MKQVHAVGVQNWLRGVWKLDILEQMYGYGALDSMPWGHSREREQTRSGVWRLWLGTLIHLLIHSFSRSFLKCLLVGALLNSRDSAVNKTESKPFLIVVCILKKEDKK